MKIQVKLFDENCKITKFNQGDWFDLKVRSNVDLCQPQAGIQYQQEGNKFRDVTFTKAILPLGIAMKLPEGFEAIIAPRSSSFKKYNVIQANSIGVVDCTYCGDTDEWGWPVVAFGNAEIPQYTRVCQFRIQPSQKATVWQKVKWLFTQKIDFEYVDSLNTESRGGFGTTGEV